MQIGVYASTTEVDMFYRISLHHVFLNIHLTLNQALKKDPNEL